MKSKHEEILKKNLEMFFSCRWQSYSLDCCKQVERSKTINCKKWINVLLRLKGCAVESLVFRICIVWVTMNNNNKWLFYDYFWPHFCQLYIHISQNWGLVQHFDVLNRSKIWLVQRLWHKMQIFPFSFFLQFCTKTLILVFCVLCHIYCTI